MDLVKVFSQDLGQYNNGTLKWVNGIVANATTQVAVYILSIIFVFELVKIYEKANASNSGNITIKMFQGMAFRISLAGIMVALSSSFLNFFMLVASGLVNLISQNANGALDVISTPNITAPDSVLDGLAGLATLVTNPSIAIGYAIAYVIGFLVSLLAYIMIAVIVLMRFFQLYIMMALAPIPMSTFVSEEYAHIGKDYLKRMAAYAFQPAVILIVMGVYHFLSKLTIDLGSSIGILSGFDGLSQMINGIVLGVVFIITLWQTHRMSSQLFGV